MRRRVQVLAIALLIPFVLLGPLHLFMPATAKAHGIPAPVQVGISFSPQRAAYLGLDYRVAFKRLEAMHFRLIRLSTYWDQVDREGYDQLDWLMSEARKSHQPVALTVGMKALGWPEFFIPASAAPVGGLHQGQDVATDSAFREAALSFVDATVDRYRDNPVLIAWQVENEPFNRAGPQRLWIDAEFLRDEIASVRALDGHHRPVIVNAFSHFNLVFDQASARQGFDFRQWLGFDADSAERDGLSVLGRGDVLGLDVYTAIGYQFLGSDHLSHADGDWPDRLARVRDLAHKQGKLAWRRARREICRQDGMKRQKGGPTMTTLFEHAGGLEALHRLEEAFYASVLKDPLLQPLFGAARIGGSRTGFSTHSNVFSTALGGGLDLTGRGACHNWPRQDETSWR